MTTDARFRDTLKTLLAALGSPDPTRRQKARQTIRDTLAVNQKSWNDLLATFQFRGQHSDKLKKLFAMLGQDIPCSRHDPKILRLDDAKVVSDLIAEDGPIAGDFFAQEAEGRVGKLGASSVAFVVGDVSVHDAP